MGKLDEVTLTGLRWARTCNERGIGFLGPTVVKSGPVPAYAPAVAAGLLECRRERSFTKYRMNASQRRSGYWLTHAGRRALAEKGEADG